MAPTVPVCAPYVSDEDFPTFYRLTRHQLDRLVKTFIDCGMPAQIKCDNGRVVPLDFAVKLFLHRWSSPSRLSDLKQLYRLDEPSISRVLKAYVCQVHMCFGGLFGSLLASPGRLANIAGDMRDYLARTYQSQPEQAAAGQFSRVVGAIDGHFVPVCRPTEDQRSHYNGYTSCHGVKLVILVLFDGLLAVCPPPAPGARHDSGIVHELGLYDSMDSVFSGYHILADSAYCLRPTILKRYTDGRAGNDPVKLASNGIHGSLRVFAENTIGLLTDQFARSLSFFKTHRTGLSHVNSTLQVVLFHFNCCLCLKGSSPAASRFGTTPPSIEAYLFQNY
jgi:hypothetical protein